jgi:D-serine deaminase-like pyridoxal phosphate-dependent protein
MNLDSLQTPSLLLDIDRVRQNADAMQVRARHWRVRLRPHIKTHKCVEVAEIQLAGLPKAVTVSTLMEAQVFASHGFRDVTYAVPIEPGKFQRAASIAHECERLAVITDDLSLVNGLNAAAGHEQAVIDVFLDVDCGYRRTGVDPRSPEVFHIVRAIRECSHLRFAGILTHAGHAYRCGTPQERLAVARQERDVMVELAARLRERDLAVPVVSIGSTPTMTAVDHLEGVDEIRPGNYVFFDAMQARLGSCRTGDCALSVLAAVVHRDLAGRKVVIDAGAIALSKDQGALELDPAAGYGRILNLEGHDLGMTISSLAQEHGTIVVSDEGVVEKLPIGARVRVLANHSCLTAAQHAHYNVVSAGEVVDRWPIHRGWHDEIAEII